MRPRVSIIIPTKNEERNIASVLVRIPNNVLKYSEVIVVDCSNDLTAKIAEKLGAKVIKTKCGKGRQMMIGVKKARGDIIVFIDGDGAHPPELIPKLLKRVRPGVMVLGSFTSSEVVKLDKLTYLSFILVRKILDTIFKYTIGFNGDPLTGFRCIHRSDLEKLNLKENGFLIETEMNIKAVQKGLQIVEVPIPSKYINLGKNFKESYFIKEFKTILKIFLLLLQNRKVQSKK